MAGAFTRSFAAVRAALDEALGTLSDAGRVAEDLWGASAVIAGSATLRRALADPSREGDAKADLVTRLFASKVTEEALAVLRTAARQRWVPASDLARGLEYVAVEALLRQAHQAGRLGQVEDELFRFNRIATGSDELRAALGDPRGDTEARGELVHRLLHGRTAPETERLARQAVTGPRSRRFDQAIEGYLSVAEAMQGQFSATVTTAVPLDDQQVQRLGRALTEQYGRPVHVNVVVDPDVVGGIRVEIGDEVIDGTISSRLDDARRRLTS